MKNWLKYNWFKLLVLLFIFIITISIFYYFVIFLPQREKIKLDLQKQAQLAEERKRLALEKEKEENKNMLNTCLENAEKNYNLNWHKECKSRGLLSQRCITILIDAPNNTTDIFSEFIKYAKNKEQTFKEYLAEKEACSCRLPAYIADDLNDYHEKHKEECFKKYPQK